MKTIWGERKQSRDSRQQQYEAAFTVAEHGTDSSWHTVPRTQLAWDFTVLYDLFISEAIGSPHRFSQGERNRGQEILCDRACICTFLPFHSLIDKTSRYLQGNVCGGAVTSVCVVVAWEEESWGVNGWSIPPNSLSWGVCSRLGVIGSVMVLDSAFWILLMWPLKENRWRCTEGTGVGAIVINPSDATSCTASKQSANF